MSKLKEVRPSPIAGQWYPADPRRLASEVDQYMDAAHLPEVGGEIVAVMAPHAGHLYSGPVAGYAFAALRGLSPEVVVVVSPMHYPYAEPLISTAHPAYATPLGEIPVDHQALQTLDGYLRQTLGEGLAFVARDPEHSLEIELPFLQRALAGPFSLLPIMLRDQDVHTAKSLGLALGRLVRESAELRGKKVLLVASTDLSHFYPQKVANQLDGEMLRQVEAFDPAGVIQTENRRQGLCLWARRAGSGAVGRQRAGRGPRPGAAPRHIGRCDRGL